MSRRMLYCYSDIIHPRYDRWEHDTDDEEYVRVTRNVARYSWSRPGDEGYETYIAWIKGFHKGKRNGKQYGKKGKDQELAEENVNLHHKIFELRTEVHQLYSVLAQRSLSAQRSLTAVAPAAAPAATTGQAEEVHSSASLEVIAELRQEIHILRNRLLQSQGNLFPVVQADTNPSTSHDVPLPDSAAEIHSAAGQEEPTSTMSRVSSASEIVFPVSDRTLFTLLEPESLSAGKGKSKGKGPSAVPTGKGLNDIRLGEQENIVSLEPFGFDQLLSQREGSSSDEQPMTVQSWLETAAQRKMEEKSNKQPVSLSCSSHDTLPGRSAYEMEYISRTRNVPFKYHHFPPPTDHSLRYTVSLDYGTVEKLRTIASEYSPQQYQFYVLNGSPETMDTCWFEPLPDDVVRTISREFLTPLDDFGSAPLIVTIDVDEHSFAYHLDTMIQVDTLTGMSRPIMLVDLADADNLPVDEAQASKLIPDHIPPQAICDICENTAVNRKHMFCWWKEKGYITEPCISSDKSPPMHTAEAETSDGSLLVPLTPASPKVHLLSSKKRQILNWIAETYNPDYHKFFVLTGERQSGKKKKNTLAFTELSADTANAIDHDLLAQLRDEYDCSYVVSFDFGKTRYEYDLAAMTQRNTRTEKIRPVILVDMETNAYNLGVSNHGSTPDRGPFASDTMCMISDRVVNRIIGDYP